MKLRAGALCITLVLPFLAIAEAQVGDEAEAEAQTKLAAPCTELATLATQDLHAPAALLYLWSPRMVLSVTQAAAIKQAASAEGLQFVPLLDPRVTPAEAHAALVQHAKESTGHSVLSACAAINNTTSEFTPEDWHHAPTMRLRLHGQLHGRRIVGVMPTAALRALLRERLEP